MGKTRGGREYKVDPKYQGRAGRKRLRQFTRGKQTRRSRRQKDLEPSTTGDIESEEDNSEKPPASVVLQHNANQKGRVTRSTKISCRVFGKYRKILYPGFRFCDNCDVWERDEALIRKSAKVDSARNACQANHASAAYPTDRLRTWTPSHQLGMRLMLNRPQSELHNPEVEEDIDLELLDYCQFVTKREDSEEDEEDEDYVDSDDSSSSETISVTEFETVGLDELDFCSTMARNVTLDEEVAILNGKVSSYKQVLLNLRETTRRLRQQVNKSTNKVKKANQTNANLLRRLSRNELPSILNNATLLEHHIEHHLNVAMATHPQGRRTAVFGKALANVVYTYKEGIAHDPIMEIARDTLRSSIFDPWKIAKVMDMNGGILNLKCLELLRGIETGGRKYIRKTLIPSTHEMQMVFAKLERMGDVVAPFTVTVLPDGEAVKFSYEKAVKLVLSSFGLSSVAEERSVHVSGAIDGANITSYLQHVVSGFKIKDRCAIDPMTGLPVFAGMHSNVQSRLMCFPTNLHMGKETKNKYNEFRDFFDFFKCSTLTGLGTWKPFTFSVNGDMSAFWKGLGRGGGSNAANYPCYCCTLHRELFAAPNTSLCSRWCHDVSDEEHPNWQCFHHPLVTDEKLEEKKEELQLLQNTMQYHIDQLTSSAITQEDPVNVRGNENAYTDTKSIWFRPLSDRARVEYSNFLNKELRLRGADVRPENVSSRREQLRTYLASESKLRRMLVEVDKSERPETALFLLLQAVPCILHMENRVALKMITVLVLEGIKNVEDGLIFNELHGEVQRIREYIQAVERIVNESILGDVWNPAQWICPYDYTEKSLGPIKFENWRSRLIMENLPQIIDISMTADGEFENRKGTWNRLVPKYLSFMEQLRQKEDWNIEEHLSKYQKDVDLWFQDWVKLHGDKHVTNYMHMLASAHVTEYVIQWGNLYEHSQQGWEAFNALIKSFFFRRTPRGGGRKKSRLRPIARWLQRRMLLLCGVTKESVEEWLLRYSELEQQGSREEQDLEEPDEMQIVRTNTSDHRDDEMEEQEQGLEDYMIRIFQQFGRNDNADDEA